MNHNNLIITKMEDLEGKIRRVLLKEHMNEEDIQFILDLIYTSDRDENLKIMNNDAFRKLEERGLNEIFENVCEKLHINWHHDNDVE